MGIKTSARRDDHVSDLKLQYLVELSKLGDHCAPLESEVERWLADHGFLYGERTIPFVIMPHFISPGQLRRLRHAVASISPCSVASVTHTARTHGCARRSSYPGKRMPWCG